MLKYIDNISQDISKLNRLILDKELQLLQIYLDELKINTGIQNIYYDEGSGSKHDFLISEDEFDASKYQYISRIHANIFENYSPLDDEEETLLSIIVMDKEYIEENKCILVEKFLDQKAHEYIEELISRTFNVSITSTFKTKDQKLTISITSLSVGKNQIGKCNYTKRYSSYVAPSFSGTTEELYAS